MNKFNEIHSTKKVLEIIKCFLLYLVQILRKFLTGCLREITTCFYSSLIARMRKNFKLSSSGNKNVYPLYISARFSYPLNVLRSYLFFSTLYSHFLTDSPFKQYVALCTHTKKFEDYIFSFNFSGTN
jgi:hypothetical protein